MSNIAWFVKYRPTSFSQILTQDLKDIEVLAECNQLPNLMIIGPQGSGKLTAAYCIADKLLGPVNYLDGFGFFDSCLVDQLGFANSKITEFSRKILPSPTYIPKICYLINANCLSDTFLHHLNQLCTRDPESMRIIFSCKKEKPQMVAKIQQLFNPIILRFKPIPPEVVCRKLVQISDLENLQYDSDGIQSLVNITEGNLKLALAYLQTAKLLNVKVDAENVSMIKQLPNPLELYRAIEFCLKRDSLNSKRIVVKVYNSGHSFNQMVDALKRAIIIYTPISEFMRSKFLEVIDHIPELFPLGPRFNLDNLRGLMQNFCDFQWFGFRGGVSSSESESSTETDPAKTLTLSTQD